MRVLVCGSRKWSNGALVRDALERALDDGMECCAHGACPTGADAIADRWLAGNKITTYPFPAEWIKHGKAAGPIRNQHMLDEFRPDKVIAFGTGKGTLDMVRRAIKAGVDVERVT